MNSGVVLNSLWDMIIPIALAYTLLSVNPMFTESKFARHPFGMVCFLIYGMLACICSYNEVIDPTAFWWLKAFYVPVFICAILYPVGVARFGWKGTK
jgi:predicted membrane-bound mannosyltransferase